MQALRNEIAIVLVFLAVGSGCTDKERELAKRSGDSSNTFKYEASPATVRTQPRGTPEKQATTEPRRKDHGSANFKYQRDARGFPAAPKSEK